MQGNIKALEYLSNFMVNLKQYKLKDDYRVILEIYEQLTYLSRKVFKVKSSQKWLKLSEIICSAEKLLKNNKCKKTKLDKTVFNHTKQILLTLKRILITKSFNIVENPLN